MYLLRGGDFSFFFFSVIGCRGVLFFLLHILIRIYIMHAKVLIVCRKTWFVSSGPFRMGTRVVVY